MNVSDTTMLKGVAILAMIWLHLFNREGNVALCDNLLFVHGDVPLSAYLARAANPVAFFLLLGGYGLYRVWQSGRPWSNRRLLRLYRMHWLILGVFLVVGHFLRPELYPGSLAKLIGGLTGWYSPYNEELWFLLPYAVLSALAPYIFRAAERVRPWAVVAVCLGINLCTSFLISRYGASFFYNNYLAYNPLLVFHLLFQFMLGATMARCNVIERLKGRLLTQNNISGGGNWRCSPCASCGDSLRDKVFRLCLLRPLRRCVRPVSAPPLGVFGAPRAWPRLHWNVDDPHVAVLLSLPRRALLPWSSAYNLPRNHRRELSAFARVYVFYGS